MGEYFIAHFYIGIVAELSNTVQYNIVQHTSTQYTVLWNHITKFNTPLVKYINSTTLFQAVILLRHGVGTKKIEDQADRMVKERMMTLDLRRKPKEGGGEEMQMGYTDQ